MADGGGYQPGLSYPAEEGHDQCGFHPPFDESLLQQTFGPIQSAAHGARGNSQSLGNFLMADPLQAMEQQGFTQMPGQAGQFSVEQLERFLADEKLFSPSETEPGSTFQTRQRLRVAVFVVVVFAGPRPSGGPRRRASLPGNGDATDGEPCGRATEKSPGKHLPHQWLYRCNGERPQKPSHCAAATVPRRQIHPDA